LKPGFPKLNPDNRQLQKVTRNGKGMEVTNIYSDGLTHQTYAYLDNGNLEYDWLFTVRWSRLPPNELVPGQEFVVRLSGEVAGSALNYHIGVSPYIDFGGLHATYDPPVTNYNNAIFVGRSGSTGIITYQAQRTLPLECPTDLWIRSI
jgi:hypothetical protein